MKWCYVVLSLLTMSCGQPIESEDREMSSGFSQFSDFIIPESGDDELDRQARLHGTGTGIRNPNQTNLGKVTTYVSGQNDIRRVLSGSVPQFDGKNWIVTVTQLGATQLDVFTNLMKARIQFGVGGGLSQLEVSIAPSLSIALPALSTYVDLVPATSAANKTDFVCTLHRGIPNGQNASARLLETYTADGAGDIRAVIPSFASKLQILNGTAAIFGAGVSLIFETPTSTLNYTGPQLTNLHLAGTLINVPAGAISFRIAGIGAGAQQSLSWEIQV